MTKSATSPRAAVDLITRATSAPHTFIFTELLLAPQIQALAQAPDYKPYLRLLEIFCYGTYEIYNSSTNLPPISAAQVLKLRQLSLLSLAQDPANLTYNNLISALDLSTALDLENLVITAIYAGLLSGTLDPYNQRVCISSVSSLRDVSPSSVPGLIATLHQWSGRCTTTLSSLEKQISTIKSDAARRRKEQKEWDAKVEKLVDGPTANNEKEKKGAQGKKGEGAVKRGFFGGTDAEEGDMDVDSDDDEIDEKRGTVGLKKKRGLGGVTLGFGR